MVMSNELKTVFIINIILLAVLVVEVYIYYNIAIEKQEKILGMIEDSQCFKIEKDRFVQCVIWQDDIIINHSQNRNI